VSWYITSMNKQMTIDTQEPTPSEVQYLYQVGQNAKQVSTKKTL
jgi:hypothetical protein